MKLLSKVLLVVTLGVAPMSGIYAEQTGGMSMNAMSEEQMGKMREHMKEMDSLLQRVKAEKDPDKRDAMLDAHAASMEKMTSTMAGKSHGMGSGKGNSSMMNKGKSDANDKMDMMEMRMTMMEEMMEQMMGHTVEKSKAKSKLHNHK